MKHHPRQSAKQSLAERIQYECPVCRGDLRTNCCGGFSGIHGFRPEHLYQELAK